MTLDKKESANKVSVSKVTSLNDMDMNDLCEATIETMKETLGFNVGKQTIDYLEKSKIQSYWEGVLMVPEISLFIGRFEGIVAGSVQLVKPGPSNQTSAFACNIENYFVAPWARGHGIANSLIEMLESEAKTLGFSIIKISVRESRQSAISVFEKRGYIKWGVLPKYELDQGQIVAGYFYYKELQP